MSERLRAFSEDPIQLARRLLGQRLVCVDSKGERLAGTIVEVEAYLGARDRAAHTYDAKSGGKGGGRRSKRNAAMFLEGGHAYVYFTYGMHHCVNVVCGKVDDGVAVLIRALEPTEGLETMFRRRTRARREKDLCSGPAKLTQALGIDLRHNGIDLREDRSLWIEKLRARALPASRIVTTPRVGVAYAGEWAHKPYRFFVRDNPHVSAGPKAGSGSKQE
jgi:DNA-3-methyladenine glycosylase